MVRPVKAPASQRHRKSSPPLPASGKKAVSSAAVRKAAAGSLRGQLEAGMTIDLLDVATSTEVKSDWAGMVRRIGKENALLILNHKRPAAVLVDPDHYASLVAAASSSVRKSTAEAAPLPFEAPEGPDPATQRQLAMARLQAEFDRRLAVLEDGQTLKAATRHRAHRGRVPVGESL
ncbi:hypothetical protein Psesu_0286 [Pseudoxanthomonas suwonensis 11-1]|uniref:Antitoxin n=1 Tax=Pseudoxanthomonas suwonensis (strain 11-1) TaxID=743721 RepID=E6WPX0_PSEUU|nr:hypothetical protein [Pseudoxanthomonas suwonensis]ADV26148.1 hypothetical protein Psesu_0286 [Pseudoxanthomonas suwonensis 11-1]